MEMGEGSCQREMERLGLWQEVGLKRKEMGVFTTILRFVLKRCHKPGSSALTPTGPTLPAPFSLGPTFPVRAKASATFRFRPP